MTDAELQEVADDANSLTEVERATLRAEMPRRGMEEPKETNSELGEAEPRAPKPSYGDEQSAARSRDPEGLLADDQAGLADLERSRSNRCGEGVELPTAAGTLRPNRSKLRRSKPVEGFFARGHIGGVVFVIEFAVCGVFRREGVAGRGVKPGIERTAR